MPRRPTISPDDLKTLSSLVGDDKSPSLARTIRLAVSTINDLEADLRSADQACEQLTSKWDELYNDGRELKSNNVALQRAMGMLEERLKRLETSNNCLTADHDASERQLGELQDKYAKLQAEHKALEASNARIHLQLGKAIRLPNASWDDCLARTAELANSERDHAPCNDQIVRTQEQANNRISAAKEQRDHAKAETALVQKQKADAMKLIQQFHRVWYAFVEAWSACLPPNSKVCGPAIYQAWGHLCREFWAPGRFEPKSLSEIKKTLLQGNRAVANTTLDSALKDILFEAGQLRKAILSSQFTVHIDPEATQLDKKELHPPLLVVSTEHFGDGWEGRVASQIPATWMSLRGERFRSKAGL